MPIQNVARQIREQKVTPQTRSEYHNLSITIEQGDMDDYGAYIQTIAFDNRYYEQPVILLGITSASYKDSDTGTLYKTHFIATLKEYLVTPNSGLYVGAKIFIRPDVLPNKLTYPITGSISIGIGGSGTEQYLGALEDAIPMFPEDSTIHDDDLELEMDAPLAPTNLTLTTGLYIDSTDKGQGYVGYIKASWDAVLHNDLHGYESDISEGDNSHYDGLPDPKFNSATYMNWMGLKRNTIYYVRVRAVDLHGNYSAWTENYVTVSGEGTVQPPTAVTIGEQPPLGVVVTWVASTTPTVVSYEINMAYVTHGASAPNFAASSKVAEVLGTAYLKTGLDITKDYYFWVRAVSSMSTYSVWVASSGQQPHLITDTTVQAASLYNALANDAVTAEKIHAGAVTANKIATGALLTYNVTVVNRLAKNGITFGSTKGGSSAFVTWFGNIDLVKYSGSSWSTINCTITYGNYNFNSTVIYYLYFTPDVIDGEPIVGTYALSISTSYPTGQYAIVVGYVNVRYVNSEWTADVVPVGSTGTIINGDHIITGSITADRISVGTITASSACIGSLDASKMTVGTLTGITLIGNTIRTSSNNERIQLDNDNHLRFYDTSGIVRGELYRYSDTQIELISYSALWIEASGVLHLTSFDNDVIIKPATGHYVQIYEDLYMITAGSRIRFEDTSHYLHKSGNDIYWWNGSTDTKLN